MQYDIALSDIKIGQNLL